MRELLEAKKTSKKPDDKTFDSEEHFSYTYFKWKKGMKAAREELKSQTEEEGLIRLIETCNMLETAVINSFKTIQETTVPQQITRIRMDSCSANTRNIITLAQTRMAEIDIKEWDQEAEDARLRSLLDVSYAKSLYSLKTFSSRQSDNSISKISEKRATAAAELASKEAELKASNVQKQEREHLRAELDRLDAEKTIAIKKAEIAAFDKELGSSCEEGKITQPTVLDPNATTFIPYSETIQAIKEGLDYNRLPTCEAPVFGGDPLQFPRWKRAFEGLIGHRKIQTPDKLAFLEKYIGLQQYAFH